MSFKADSWEVNNALLEEKNIRGNVAVSYSGAKQLMEEGSPEWVRRTVSKIEDKIPGSFHDWNVSYETEENIVHANFETTYDFQKSNFFRSIPLDTSNTHFLPSSKREPLEVELITNYDLGEEEFQELFRNARK